MRLSSVYSHSTPSVEQLTGGGAVVVADTSVGGSVGGYAVVGSQGSVVVVGGSQGSVVGGGSVGGPVVGRE